MISKKKILTESNSPDPAIFDLSLGKKFIIDVKDKKRNPYPKDYLEELNFLLSCHDSL